MCSRICGGQVHFFPFLCQPQGDSGRNSGFAHAAFAHCKNDFSPGFVNGVYNIVQPIKILCIRSLILYILTILPQHGADIIQTGNVVSPQGNQVGSKCLQSLWDGLHRCLLLLIQLFRDGVVTLEQDTVHHQNLIVHTQVGQFQRSPLGFFQRRLFGASDQNQCCEISVSQRCSSLFVNGLFALKAGELAQAGCSVGAFTDEIAPCGGELKHS